HLKMLIKVPLKATLFGEHAVVYGKPAIAFTLPLHILVEAMDVHEQKIVVEFNNVLLPIRKIEFNREDNLFSKTEVDNDVAKRFVSYIATAIGLCEDEVKPGRRRGFIMYLKSPVPTGVGLGTSAAVSVATTTLCLSTYLSTTEIEKSLIAKLSWRTEQIVQGVASPMDTYTITFGGIRYIDPATPKAEPLPTPTKMNLIVGYTPKKSTTAVLVSNVKKLLKSSISASKIVDAIGSIVEEARSSILQGDAERIGILMNLNHGLLDSLGVVSLEHHTIVNTLRGAGALGAKTSGAGGGGAFIALARDEEHANILKRVAEALGATIVATGIESTGVEVVEKGEM
ncbi:MAG: mevalonate kinase, partial [Ignisphaera sp.]